MMAWKLTTDFDKQRQLFFKKITTDYVIQTYICSCGHTEFIVMQSNEELEYSCIKCDNHIYYDVNHDWNNIENCTSKNESILYKYKTKKTAEYVSSQYIIYVPNQINFISKKVMYQEKILYSFTLKSNGEFEEDYILAYDEKIFTKLKINLKTFLNEHDCLEIPERGTKELTFNIATFFLENKHLRDFVFTEWIDTSMLIGDNITVTTALEIISNYTRAKSVKKAIYKNYCTQIDDTDMFDPIPINALCHHIEDVNILVKFLALKFEYSTTQSDYVNGLGSVLQFLKRYYTEKQI